MKPGKKNFTKNGTHSFDRQFVSRFYHLLHVQLKLTLEVSIESNSCAYTKLHTKARIYLRKCTLNLKTPNINIMWY